jgi:hypothetical protein
VDGSVALPDGRGIVSDAVVMEEEWGTTYYVRPSGGDAAQCDGRADAPYPGAGQAQACAWKHPFFALPPGGSPRISAGDRLLVGKGSYRMGVFAPGAEGCDAAWDCFMASPPSGLDAGHPTRIVGEGFDTGCAAAPELWGTERAGRVVNLDGVSHVRVECLEITDHDPCVPFHSGGLACRRDNAPYGDWAEIGLVARDSSDVTLRRLDVHGLGSSGIFAGRLHDWTVVDVRIAANGWSGWDGDIEGNDANTGTLRFSRVTVEYNGCGETYPGKLPTGCWAQSAGGYGDGVGTGETGGDWIIEDSSFLHNTSDGLDLLYHRLGGSIVLERVRAEGNAGNQVKTTGDTTIRNSLIVGDCGYFTGKSFTYQVDDCRAAGNALAFEVEGGDDVTLVNNTVYSEGDCLMEATGGCQGASRFTTRNNIFLGGPDYLSPGERTCLFYTECSRHTFNPQHDLIFGTKDGECPSGDGNLCLDPQLVNMSPATFDAKLEPASKARDSGLPVGGLVPSVDLEGRARPQGSGVDRGAYEM